MHEIQMLGLLAHDVYSDIAIPFLPDPPSGSPPGDGFFADCLPSAFEAEKFDTDVFALKTERKPSLSSRQSLSSSSASGTIMSSSYRSPSDRRILHRESGVTKITPIEESPRQDIADLPPDAPDTVEKAVSGLSHVLSTSPSQASILSVRSRSPTTSIPPSREPPSSRTSLTSKFAPNWLLKPFRSTQPTEPQPSPVSASSSLTLFSTRSPDVTRPSSPVPMSEPATQASSRPPKPVAIRKVPPNRSVINRAFDEDLVMSHRRRSPLSTPPRDEPNFGKRRSGTITSSIPMSSSPGSRTNPSRPQSSMPYAQSSLARRWEHMFPQFSYKHEIKWKSIITPGCLPLTVDYFPTASELDSSYDVSSWHFVVDPQEMRPFLVQPPNVKGHADEVRRAWALGIMRGMAAVRLAQGFQFVLRPTKAVEVEDKVHSRSRKSFIVGEDMTPRQAGAAEVLNSTNDPVYLSMSNEIHQISYTGEAIQVRRYVRRVPPTRPFDYQCLIWPKLGVGYTEWKTSFVSQGPENYGWNRSALL